MRRDDAVRGLIMAVGLITAGATWLFGAWAMIVAGVVLAVVLLAMPVKDEG